MERSIELLALAHRMLHQTDWHTDPILEEMYYMIKEHKEVKKVMGEKIEEGDIVNVYFENAGAEFGLHVLYIPCATGDSWRFKRTNGTIIYIQNFAKMVRQ